ncbi:hypothetical protein FRC17_009656 [Serendipita sp. 399]|nr:hypothetical protein FRC17_009656 [Serendipita sp. 399]
MFFHIRAFPLAPAPERSANFTQCRDNILHHSLAYEPYLVNMDRQLTSNDSEVVGSDLGTCKAYCGTSSSSFQWSSFSSQFAGWLLLFLALTAQLPFESKGTWHNFMCLFLTVGSPQLAMYSLALTILNSRYVKKLLDTLPTPKEDEERLQLNELKESIFQAFRFSQQEPFALATYDAASVVDLATLRSWWRSVRHCLARNSRWFTASLATQAAWAIIAFGFTWVDAFGSPKLTPQFGTNVTAFGLAISLCWSWVAVIVLGWFFAGVSFMSFPVIAAIEQADAMQPNAFPRLAKYQRPPNRRNPSHYFLLRRITGDAEHNGPIYNYARVLVWSHMVYHVVEIIGQQLGQQNQPQLVQHHRLALAGEQGEDEQHELQRVPTSVSSEIRRSNVALGVSQGSVHMRQTERRTTLPVIEYELVGPLAGEPEGDEFWRSDSPISAAQSSATPLHLPSSVEGDESYTFLIPPTTRIAERTESTESNQGQLDSHHQDQLLAAASTLNLAHVQVAQNSALDNESQRSPLSPNADINPRSIVLPIVTRFFGRTRWRWLNGSMMLMLACAGHL